MELSDTLINERVIRLVMVNVRRRLSLNFHQRSSRLQFTRFCRYSLLLMIRRAFNYLIYVNQGQLLPLLYLQVCDVFSIDLQVTVHSVPVESGCV